MIHQNLFKSLIAVAEEMTGETYDRRFKTWAKLLTQVQTDGKDGYAFSGEWVNDGTTELPDGKPFVALVSFRHGSMKYNYGEYAIVKITADGELEPTEIMASERGGKGWALRIRDDVIALLAELEASPAEAESDKLTVRERRYMSLGYNQAMLDHATFPITGAGDPWSRDSVENIVAQLKAKLFIA